MACFHESLASGGAHYDYCETWSYTKTPTHLGGTVWGTGDLEFFDGCIDLRDGPCAGALFDLLRIYSSLTGLNGQLDEAQSRATNTKRLGTGFNFYGVSWTPETEQGEGCYNIEGQDHPDLFVGTAEYPIPCDHYNLGFLSSAQTEAWADGWFLDVYDMAEVDVQHSGSMGAAVSRGEITGGGD